VIVRFGKFEKKTKTMKNTLNPQYNEQFAFPFDPVRNEHTVRFTIFDWNAITSHQFMGQVDLDCSAFPPSTIVDNWHSVFVDEDTQEKERRKQLQLDEKKKEVERKEDERRQKEGHKREKIEHHAEKRRQKILESHAKKQDELISSKNDSADEGTTVPSLEQDESNQQPLQEQLQPSQQQQKKQEEKQISAPEDLDADIMQISDPYERWRQKFERHFGPWSNVVLYSYSVVTWKRPVDFGVMCGVILIIFSIVMWLDLTVISLISILFAATFLVWWLAEFVHINVPWARVLGDSPQSPKLAFKLLASVVVTALNFYAQLKRVSATPKTIVLFCVIAFATNQISGYSLWFFFVYGTVLSPGLSCRLHKQNEMQRGAKQKKID